MAKSSATAALKSLSYKFQQKIKEVGELKRKLANEEHQNEVIRNLEGEVQGWQQFCVIATVLGAVIGGLGVYAYLTL